MLYLNTLRSILGDGTSEGAAFNLTLEPLPSYTLRARFARFSGRKRFSSGNIFRKKIYVQFFLPYCFSITY
jgi:hypothetical protein